MSTEKEVKELLIFKAIENNERITKILELSFTDLDIPNKDKLYTRLEGLNRQFKACKDNKTVQSIVSENNSFKSENRELREKLERLEDGNEIKEGLLQKENKESFLYNCIVAIAKYSGDVKFLMEATEKFISK